MKLLDLPKIKNKIFRKETYTSKELPYVQCIYRAIMRFSNNFCEEFQYLKIV